MSNFETMLRCDSAWLLFESTRSRDRVEKRAQHPTPHSSTQPRPPPWLILSTQHRSSYWNTRPQRRRSRTFFILFFQIFNPHLNIHKFPTYPAFVTDILYIATQSYTYNHHSFTYLLHPHSFVWSFPFSFSVFGSCCVRAHTETYMVRFRVFRGGHLWLCYLW